MKILKEKRAILTDCDNNNISDSSSIARKMQHTSLRRFRVLDRTAVGRCINRLLVIPERTGRRVVCDHFDRLGFQTDPRHGSETSSDSDGFLTGSIHGIWKKMER